MLEVKNLTKTYGKKNAITDVSFTVNSGEILGFLGPNGAGKTTTMNIIAGYIAASEGRVYIDGHDVSSEPLICKEKIGYLPEQPPLYMNMTVSEYLDFVYDLKKVRKNKSIGSNKRKYIADIMKLIKIDDVAGRVIKNLSKGYKQRVGIAQALIGNPQILILDEPTVGLDPKQILEIRNVIKELGRDRTVVVSSHILSEISAVCERVIIISNGKVLAEDTPENLSERLGNSSRFLARIEGSRADIENELKGVFGIRKYTFAESKEDGTYDFIIEASNGTDIRKQLFKTLAQKDMALLMLNPVSLTLEDVFIELTENDISLIQNEGLTQNTEDKGAEI